jgi:hypothetical protein
LALGAGHHRGRHGGRHDRRDHQARVGRASLRQCPRSERDCMQRASPTPPARPVDLAG